MPRLIDLHTDWLLQYAPETTLYDPALYADVPQRLAQSEGYLQATWAAVVSCFRRAEDWEGQADPWRALGELITRIEAEFPGRILIGPEDYLRWAADPQSLCWAMIGIEGFDVLVRAPADLDRLPALFERGVRLFQPVYSANNVLAGSSIPGDDRGLTELGARFLETLAGLAGDDRAPRPLFDLAHLNPAAASVALAWFEADGSRTERLMPVYSHGALFHEGYAKPRAITLENLKRLRTLGGVVGFSVGPPFYQSAEQIKAGIETAAALPFLGRAGYEGIGIGTDFLGVSRTLPGMSNAPEVVAWVESAFDAVTASSLLCRNAQRLLASVVGVGMDP